MKIRHWWLAVFAAVCTVGSLLAKRRNILSVTLLPCKFMADYDNKRFTETVLRLYAEMLRQRLPRVKFMLVDDGDATSRAIKDGLLRQIGQYTKSELRFSLDPLTRPDGSLDEEMLAEAVASGLAEPLITAAENELKAEEDDPINRIGAGELWVLHKVIPVAFTLGGAQAHFAQDGKIGLFGQTWFEGKNLFMARTEWAIARSGEVKKEPLDLDALRQGEPPL